MNQNEITDAAVTLGRKGGSANTPAQQAQRSQAKPGAGKPSGSVSHYYVREWKAGKAVHANTGKDFCTVLRFASRQDADEFVDGYRAPNYCPRAFAERINSKEARRYFPRVNQWGEESDIWVPSECGTYEWI